MPMEHFELNSAISFVGWILGGAVALKAGVWAIIDMVKAFKAPNNALEQRVKALEENKQNHCDKCFSNDKEAIRLLSDGNAITQQTLLALLGHALHGNNVDEMEAAYSSLTNHLIYKK